MFLFQLCSETGASWSSDITRAVPSFTRATLASRTSEEPFLFLGTEKQRHCGPENLPTPKTLHNARGQSIPTMQNLLAPPSGRSRLSTQENVHAPQWCQLTSERAINSTSAPSSRGACLHTPPLSLQRLGQGQGWPLELWAPKFLADLLSHSQCSSRLFGHSARHLCLLASLIFPNHLCPATCTWVTNIGLPSSSSHTCGTSSHTASTPMQMA